MKRFTSVLIFLLLTVSAFSQSLKVYPLGSTQIAVDDGTGLSVLPANNVSWYFGPSDILLQAGTRSRTLQPSQFQKADGTVYGSTTQVARLAWISALQAAGQVAGGSTGGSSSVVLANSISDTDASKALAAPVGKRLADSLQNHLQLIRQNATVANAAQPKVAGKDLSSNDYTNTDKAKVAATSGTNTGDETATGIRSKLGITNLSGSNTGDQIVDNVLTGTDPTHALSSPMGKVLADSNNAQRTDINANKLATTTNAVALGRNSAALYNGPLNRPFVTTRNFTERNPNASQSNGTTDTIQTYKVKRVITQNTTDIQLIYFNGASNPISYTVVVQTSSGTNYPVYFQGRRSPTVDSKGFIESDPLSINLAKGDFIWVVNTVGVAKSGLRWDKPQVVTDAGGGAAATGADFSGGGGTYTSTAAVHSPVAIVGRVVSPAGQANRVPVICLNGDSIGFGQGANQEEGYLAAFGSYGANYSTIQMSQSGATINNFTNNIHLKKYLLASCTAVICEGGFNDIFNSGNSLATVQASMITLWRSLGWQGIRVFQTTITPRTSSTDGWSTVANQSIADATKEGVRTGINDWIRDGAPVNSSLVAVAVGTTAAGTLRMGQSGHPLVNYFDTADKAETSRNSGKWIVSPVPTGDGVHPNTAGNTVITSAIDVPQVLVLGMAN